MYLDTHSYSTMFQSACEYFDVTPSGLTHFLDETAQKCLQDKCCNGDILSEEIETFIQAHSSHQCIDEIMLFHLGRRLNSTNIPIGNNLFELLTTENPVSVFLTDHNVRFAVHDKHLEIIENGVNVPLDDTYKSGVCYLRSRLGYNEGCEDFCFNGFAFKDLLYKNNYARSLYHGPEIITQLATFLKRPDIARDYFSSSTYYCYEYCVPLNMVLFDDDDKLTQIEKAPYFLARLLNRLFEYATSDSRYLFDHDNPVLRLNDGTNMPSEFYCDREKITYEMLR